MSVDRDQYQRQFTSALSTIRENDVSDFIYLLHEANLSGNQFRHLDKLVCGQSTMQIASEERALEKSVRDSVREAFHNLAEFGEREEVPLQEIFRDTFE